jgi:hypothetical protein
MKRAFATLAAGMMLSVTAPTGAFAAESSRMGGWDGGDRGSRCDRDFRPVPTYIAGFLRFVDQNDNGTVCVKFSNGELRFRDDKSKGWKDRGGGWHGGGGW